MVNEQEEHPLTELLRSQFAEGENSRTLDPALVGIIAREFPDYRTLADIRNLYEITKRRVREVHHGEGFMFNPNECLTISTIRVCFPRFFYQIIRNEIPLGELISQCTEISDEDQLGADYKTRVSRAFEAFNRAVPPFVRRCFSHDPRYQYLSINYLFYMADWEGDLTGAAWVFMNSSRDSMVSSLTLDEAGARGIIACYPPREWMRRITSNLDFFEYVCSRLPRRLVGQQSTATSRRSVREDTNKTSGAPRVTGRVWIPSIEQSIYEALRHSLRPQGNEANDVTVYCAHNRCYRNLRSKYFQLPLGVQQRLMLYVLQQVSERIGPQHTIEATAGTVADRERRIQTAKSFIRLADDLYTNSEASVDKTFSHYVSESDAGTCRNGMLLMPDDAVIYSGSEQYSNRERALRESLAGRFENIGKATDRNALGVLYQHMRRYEEAERMYMSALDLCHKAHASNDALAAAVHSNLGTMYAITNRFDLASRHLDDALRICRTMPGGDKSDVKQSVKYSAERRTGWLADTNVMTARVLNNCGTLYIKLEQFQDAKASLAEALRRLNSHVADILEEFGKSKTDEAAARIDETCSKLTTLAIGDLDVAMVLNNLCNLNRRTSGLHEAQVESVIAHDIVDRLATRYWLRRAANAGTSVPSSSGEIGPLVNPYAPYVAATLNNLGNILRRNKNIPKAKARLNASLRIYRHLAARLSNVGIDMYQPDVAMVCNNLGNMYGDRADTYDEAVHALDDALNVRARMSFSDPNDPDTAMMRNNLGIIYCKKQDFTNAKDQFEQSLFARSALAQSESPIVSAVFLPRVADVENNLGNLYMRIHSRADAGNEFASALDRYSRLCQSDTPQDKGAYLPRKAMTLNNLGILCIQTGQLEDAERRLTESCKEYLYLIHKLAGDTFRPRLAMVYNNLGDLYRLMHRPKQAEDNLNNAMEIYRQLDGSLYDSNKATTLNNLCMLWQDRLDDGRTPLEDVREQLHKYETEMNKVCAKEPWRVLPVNTLLQLLDQQADDIATDTTVSSSLPGRRPQREPDTSQVEGVR